MADERLTLVVTREGHPAWNPAHVLCVDSLPRMHATLGALDVERIILDNTVSAEEYLFLLAKLPHEVAGDVVLLTESGGAFISATGRGGDRVMYALAAHDVGFYLDNYDLVSRRDHLAASA
ncbi:MAG TPA: hypothetical protein VEU30_17060 [Thermoanaerobaculia bacterium]|nr:hypothetical protein [Thermoanaerobaculia bacterium]